MLLSVENIYKSFSDGGLPWMAKRHQVLRGITLQLEQGECLGIVGESGSGKSTLGRIFLGLEKPDSGKINFSEALKRLRSHEQRSIVFQDYRSSVNPRQTVCEIVQEPLLLTGANPDSSHDKIVNLLEEVGLKSHYLHRLPHQLSGGQLQRVCIARAISTNPRFILFDEAVSSLDVSIQVQILDLLLELKATRNLSYIFITHDIAVAAYLCDRLIFFHEGQIVEELNGTTGLNKAKHPYTKQLLDAARYLEMKF